MQTAFPLDGLSDIVVDYERGRRTYGKPHSVLFPRTHTTLLT